MDDLLRVAATIASSEKDDPPLAIATVVNTRGSAFRRPGARMLIKQSGQIHGCISAGCLEKDVIAHCEGMTAHTSPFLLSYDGGNRDDLVFGLHLGCDGLIEILVEPYSAKSLFNQLPDLQAQAGGMSAVTIFDVVGDRMPLGLSYLRLPEASSRSGALPTSLQDTLDREAELVFRDRRSRLVDIDIQGTRIRAFVEFVTAVPTILIIGNGAELDPLVGIIRILEWNYTVVDDRKGRVITYNLGSHEEYTIDLTQLPAWLGQSPAQAAVLMTHNYDQDKTILRSILQCNFGYIGTIGPRKRTDKLLAEMVLQGVTISEAQTDRLYSPVGLDIGAERPEEIALSIAAEIQAALSKRSAGFLKARCGPIHDGVRGQMDEASSQVRSVICEV